MTDVVNPPIPSRELPPPGGSPVSEQPPSKRNRDTRWWNIEITPERVKPAEVMNFSRQCAAFVRAGIPLLDALDVIAEDTASKRFGRVLADISASLRAGNSFSGAVARHDDVFPAYYISMLRSAELTGRLDDTLDQLAVYLERDMEARRRIKSALTYPLVVMVMAVVTVVILAAFVMPKFEDFFADLGAELPLITRMLLAVTHFVSTWWWALALLALVVVLAFVVTRRSPRGRAKLDGVLLKLPALGGLLQYVIVERFCRIFAAMVQAGVPLPDAMTVAAESTNNAVYRVGLLKARDEMMQGAGLARPIADTGLFPASANQMMRVGESTGTLDHQLETAAQFYERELDYRLKRFTDLFEPAVIIAVGVVVGFVAVALVSAMYGVYDQVDIQ